ncbi:hypothetical protein GGR50DRAFT_567826 [Xylaria sp. CBS 124048]|nr:hypothetical protein GGR50DRAFT_567826 [Xylaria sp. CBS 124048]
MSADQTRDLRSVAHDTKRAKDHSHKWARGNRPSPGVMYKFRTPEGYWTGSEEQQAKVRPQRASANKHIRTPNINKPVASSYMGYKIPRSHWQHKANVRLELQDPSNLSRSLHELLPSSYTQRTPSISEDVLYSFDETESPGRPLSLEVFVKTNTKETEKFVEREYEILDYNGDAVKGRKALKDLHRGKTMGPAAEPEIIEDDGFELV